MLAAVGQLCSTSNLSRNLKIAQSLIKRAAKAKAKLLFLPEATDFIAPADQVKHLSQALDQPGGFVDSIRKQARESQCWVNVGVHEKGSDDKGRCYNTNLLIDDRGEIVSSYRKIHLFDVAISGGTHILESNTTIPGDKLEDPVSTPMGKLGLLTCFDLRFPELSLSLRRRGAQLLTFPSAFTVKTGKAHWETLLRARAIETQCYVFASAQFGTHAQGRMSYGHSMIVGPFGEVLNSIDEADEESYGEGTIITAEVNLSVLEQIRKEIPLWDQRRYDIYPEL